MSQDLIDRIRAQAQAKNIDPDLAVRIARAESSMDPTAKAKTSTAGGLFQVIDKTWKEFGGDPKKKFDADENIRVGTDIIAKNTDFLRRTLNRDPRPAEVYAAHYFGPTGAKQFLTADPATPIANVFSASIIKANPNLKGKTAGQVLSQLEGRVGGSPAPVSRETIAPAPAPREQRPLESLPPMAAAPKETGTGMSERIASLGPSYQAALALSVLADTDDTPGEKDIDNKPSVAEQWLAQTESRTANLGLSDIKVRSPFEGMEPQQPMMLADGGEATAEELEKASKPAFVTPKSGIGRKISTKPGELEAAALQGVSETPYLLAGAPVDLATMAMRPFGYDVEKPMFGSEDLKERALRAGLRQEPPKGAAARALYEMGQLGGSMVNPTAPVRGAIKVAEKTGEAAKMLARDFQQYNQQLSVPGASYAVRQKATPLVISPRTPVTTDDFHSSMSRSELKAFQEKNPDVALYSEREMATTPEFQAFAKKANAPVDAAEDLVKRELATTPDSALNSWFKTALPRYLRVDFASPQDQLVQAAGDGKLLHLAPKKFSDYNAVDVKTKNFIESNTKDVEQFRRTEGFEPGGEFRSFPDTPEGRAKKAYKENVEALTDLAAYPERVGELTPNQVPPSMRSLVQTNPEARALDLAPNIGGILKLPELRDKMLEIRALGPNAEYAAYGQAPAKVPSEFLLPDDTLAKLNVAAASNRVARYTRWQDETRQGMATTALRTDPRLNPMPLQDGKYVAVSLPDPDIYPDYMRLINDVGCDGGWCTQAEGLALTYGSGDSRLHVIVTGEGSKARPVAQISVEKGVAKDGSLRYGISEIKEKGDTTDFLTNPALPAIQQYVQSLDSTHGGLRFVSDLKALGMKELPKSMDSAMRAKAIGLNNGSQYVIGDDNAVRDLLDRAAGGGLYKPQQRAAGGMIERQSTDSRKYL